VIAFGHLADADPERPNIVFIMADDLGYGHLGCYGQDKIRTPNLDRLASEGIRFTDVYAGSCVCAPSRSVLMTGLHGGHTSVRGNSGGIGLEPDDITVAEVLKEAGYVTGVFGKWGLGDYGTDGVPWKQGFDEFFGYLHQFHAHFYYPEYLWNNDQRFPLEGNVDGLSGRYTHDEIVVKALSFIERHRDQPFFLYIPFALPHFELLVPEDSLAEYAGAFPETPYEGRGRGTGYPFDYAKQPMPKAATAGMITRMDRSVGKILTLLRELGLEDHTIVFFTSDNGPAGKASDPGFFRAAGPFRGIKRSLFEGGLRVPMIVRWPGRIVPSAVDSTPWYFADVLPTLADIGGGMTPTGLDGRSVRTLFEGEDQPIEPRDFYWEFKGTAAVRSGDWKAVREMEPNARVELYDLSRDPGETNDLARLNPEVAARLTEILVESHIEPRPQIEPPLPAGQRYR
jgi:arylsulfatase A-like enzyme